MWSMTSASDVAVMTSAGDVAVMTSAGDVTVMTSPKADVSWCRSGAWRRVKKVRQRVKKFVNAWSA